MTVQQPEEVVRVVVNGSEMTLTVDPQRTLLDVLRNDLGLRASHFGCGSGECGACMVLVDLQAQPACDTPMWAIAGKSIVTIEGLGDASRPHPVQRAFIAEQAAQCGYCTSGMVIAAASLLHKNPHPDDAEIRAAMDRNLCRCGTHPRVVRAIVRAAEEGVS
jgi:nicotinate dehydrogenase subunit A